MKFRLTNISSLQIFHLLRFGTFILIGVVFTKTSLTTESIGEYEQFLFLAGAVSFFWLNGLIRGLLPISKDERAGSQSPVFNAFLLISFFTVLVIGALLAVSQPVVGKSIGIDSFPYLYLLLAYLFFSVPANLVEYFFLLRNQTRAIVFYGGISFSVLLLLVSLPTVLGMPIQFSLYGLVLAAFMRYAYLLLLIVRAQENHFSWTFMKEHLTLSSPLIFSALLGGSAQYVDGFIITSKFDEAAFAVFRYGARELPFVLLLANAFSNALLPELSNKDLLIETLTKIKRESTRLANYLFPLSAALLVASHELFPIVFNSHFAESATVFNIYLLLIVSRLVFPQTLLIGLKQTKSIAWASFWEFLLNVSLSLWFVQFWGIAGVAYATVVAYLFEKLYLIVIVQNKLNISITKYQNISRHLIYSLLLLILFYVVEFVIY
jgi:O-antigen/teichoic acid export membrane protein